MSPTTRAASKGQAPHAKKFAYRSIKKTKAKPTKLHIKEQPPCRLLELPPELRNRIYHFAKEIKFDANGSEPPLLVKTSTAAKGVFHYSGRVFFSLTQTCKQIRSEFRPLWLRNSAVRIVFGDLSAFLMTYYPKTDEYCNAPKLLVIPWDHDSTNEEGVLFNFTPLFRLRAFCPTFVAAFRCRRVLDGDLPYVDCDDCGHSLSCGCETYCDHQNAIDDALCDLYREYSYTEVLDLILGNNNVDWLKALREDAGTKSMHVECTIDVGDQRLAIYIRFDQGTAPPFLDKETMYSGAFRFLKQMGFLDLKPRDQFDFIIGVATGKYTRYFEDCSFSVPEYNQIEIPGDIDAKDITSSETATPA